MNQDKAPNWNYGDEEPDTPANTPDKGFSFFKPPIPQEQVFFSYLEQQRRSQEAGDDDEDEEDEEGDKKLKKKRRKAARGINSLFRSLAASEDAPSQNVRPENPVQNEARSAMNLETPAMLPGEESNANQQVQAEGLQQTHETNDQPIREQELIENEAPQEAAETRENEKVERDIDLQAQETAAASISESEEPEGIALFSEKPVATDEKAEDKIKTFEASSASVPPIIPPPIRPLSAPGPRGTQRFAPPEALRTETEETVVIEHKTPVGAIVAFLGADYLSRRRDRKIRRKLKQRTAEIRNNAAEFRGGQRAEKSQRLETDRMQQAKIENLAARQTRTEDEVRENRGRLQQIESPHSPGGQTDIREQAQVSRGNIVEQVVSSEQAKREVAKSIIPDALENKQTRIKEELKEVLNLQPSQIAEIAAASYPETLGGDSQDRERLNAPRQASYKREKMPASMAYSGARTTANGQDIPPNPSQKEGYKQKLAEKYGSENIQAVQYGMGAAVFLLVLSLVAYALR